MPATCLVAIMAVCLHCHGTAQLVLVWMMCAGAAIVYASPLTAAPCTSQTHPLGASLHSTTTRQVGLLGWLAAWLQLMSAAQVHTHESILQRMPARHAPKLGSHTHQPVLYGCTNLTCLGASPTTAYAMAGTSVLLPALACLPVHKRTRIPAYP